MRTFTTLFLAAIAAIAALAAPAPREVNWPAIRTLVIEIQAVVTDAGKQITASVNAGTQDQVVRDAIITQLAITQVKLSTLMDQANAAVEAQIVTIAQVQTLSSSLKSELGQFLGRVSAQLALLNPINAAEIEATKKACFDGINIRVEQVVVLLTPAAGETLVIDWNAVQENVNQIITVLTTVNDNIVDDLQGRLEIGAGTILEKLQMVRINSAPVLNRLNTGAGDQTLTRAQAGDEIGALEKLLGKFKGEIQQPLNTLPAAVADNVRGNVTNAQNVVGDLGGELKKLLAA